MAEHGLAFSGDNELDGSLRNGNYLGILEFLSGYDTFLAEHIQKQEKKKGGTKLSIFNHV